MKDCARFVYSCEAKEKMLVFCSLNFTEKFVEENSRCHRTGGDRDFRRDCETD